MSKISKAYHDTVKLLKKHQTEIELALAALSILGAAFVEVDAEIHAENLEDNSRLPSDPEITI